MGSRAMVVTRKAAGSSVEELVLLQGPRNPSILTPTRRPDPPVPTFRPLCQKLLKF